MAATILYFGAIIGGLLANALLPKNGTPPRLQLSFAVFPSLHCGGRGKHVALAKRAEIDRKHDHHQRSGCADLAEIASVRTIPSGQIAERWIYLVGFPKPISATLDRPILGGIRTAKFERDVSFFETVTQWEPPHRLSFTIHADPNFIPHTAFDQHIIVGGRFYDVLDGSYEIKPLNWQQCRLHLVSHHRLGTRFNAYASWWSGKIMDQIQSSILEVIRARAEAAANSAKPVGGVTYRGQE